MKIDIFLCWNLIQLGECVFASRAPGFDFVTDLLQMLELVCHLKGFEDLSSLFGKAIKRIKVTLVTVLALHLHIVQLFAPLPILSELLKRLGGHGAVQQHELAVLQVSLLVVFLDEHLRGVAPLLHGLDPVVKVYESGRLDACLVDLLHKTEGLLELLLDSLG